MHFSEKVYSIENAVRQLELPLVIRSENEYPKDARPKTNCEDTGQLQPDSINVLERKITCQFAGVTVMGPSESNITEGDDGINFVKSQGDVKGDRILLPTTFSGKCRLIHPPGKSKRYTNVTELIKDLPWMVRVNDELKLVDLDSMTTHDVSPGTVLQVVALKAAVGQSKVRSLICQTPEQRKHILKEDMVVNLTAVDDQNTYSLKQLADMNIVLPKFIEFQEVSPHDIVMSNDVSARYLAVVTNRPLRINYFETQKFMLSWSFAPITNASSSSSFNLALIPKQKWRKEKLKVRNFGSESEKTEYIRKHFPGRKDSVFLKYKLFLLEDKDEPGIIYLQDRVQVFDVEETGKETKDNASRPPAVVLEREPFPDSDVDDYEKVTPRAEIPPDLPPKTLKKTKQTKKESEKPSGKWQEVKTWTSSVIQSGIMQSNLMQRLLRRSQSVQSPTRSKQQTKQALKFQRSLSVDQQVISEPNLKLSESTTETVGSYMPSSSFYFTEFADSKNNTKEKYNEEHMFLARDKTTATTRLSIPETEKTKGTCESKMKSEYPCSYEEEQDQRPEQDSGIDVTDLGNVLREGQTEEDFYDYSIEQVTYFFKKIALPDIANLCEKERIDGSFFRGLSEEEMKMYFSLKPFHFIKAKKAIFDGWRPK